MFRELRMQVGRTMVPINPRMRNRPRVPNCGRHALGIGELRAEPFEGEHPHPSHSRISRHAVKSRYAP